MRRWLDPRLVLGGLPGQRPGRRHDHHQGLCDAERRCHAQRGPRRSAQPDLGGRRERILDIEDTVVINGDSGTGAFNELSITKTQVTANPVATSSVVTYHIVVTNNGTDPAVNVKVRDFVPVGFSYIEAKDTAFGTPNAFLCTAAASVINCNGATIPGGSSRTIEVKLFSGTAPGVFTNQALVNPDNNIPEGNETNNSASAQTTVVVGAGFIDLSIIKCDAAIVAGCQPPAAPSTKDSGSLFTYFIR